MPTTSVSGSDLSQQIGGIVRLLRRNPQLAVRHDVVVGVAGVHGRLEDLYALPRNLRAAQPADELFALAAEHAADDDLDPPRVRGADNIHIRIIGLAVQGSKVPPVRRDIRWNSADWNRLKPARRGRCRKGAKAASTASRNASRRPMRSRVKHAPGAARACARWDR